MNTKLTLQQVAALVHRAHPSWSSEGCEVDARRLLDAAPALHEALIAYHRDGTETDCSHGEFSIRTIRALRGCGYLDALLLLDDYIRDPVVGRRRILRRR